jgi:hypothetical protein
LPRTWALREGVLKDAPVMALPLADLERFDGEHSGKLGSHARNIMAVAPEVGLPPSYCSDAGTCSGAQPPFQPSCELSNDGMPDAGRPASRQIRQ